MLTCTHARTQPETRGKYRTAAGYERGEMGISVQRVFIQLMGTVAKGYKL